MYHFNEALNLTRPSGEKSILNRSQPTIHDESHCKIDGWKSLESTHPLLDKNEKFADPRQIDFFKTTNDIFLLIW